MREITTDVAIIGAGTAGLSARRAVEAAGKDWVLIEAGPYGTTCARVGCMPSKLLIAAADAAHEARHAPRFGVHTSGLHIDGREVMDRVRRERDRFAGFVVRDTEALLPSRRLHGRARFVGPSTVEVDAHTRVFATSVVVATGSSPWVPPLLDGVRDRVDQNDDLFGWRDLPRSVAVFGTGVIGLELGQALHRLGVDVTLFNPFDQLGPFTDPEVGASARRVLGDELDLHLGVDVHDVRPHRDGVCVTWTDTHGVRRARHVERVLAAAGRRPNLDGFGLEALGVEVDGRGLPVTDPTVLQLRAADGPLPIFLAGDVSGHRPLLHEAADEGRIAGAGAAAFPPPVATVRRDPLAIAFTAPQMAMVGARWADLADRDDVVAGAVRYDDQGRARVMGQNAGLVRIYARRSDLELLGAEMFGPRVEHTAHLLAWAIAEGITATRALELPFYHPVIEEGIRTALRDVVATGANRAGRSSAA